MIFIPTSFVKTKEFIKHFRPTVTELNNLLTFNKIFIERTANVGILPIDTAINFGASGPVLRGSGLAFDVRKEDPYSIYNRFDFEIPTGKGLVGTVGRLLGSLLCSRSGDGTKCTYNRTGNR